MVKEIESWNCFAEVLRKVDREYFNEIVLQKYYAKWTENTLMKC